MPWSRTCEESDVLVKSQTCIFLALKHMTKQPPAEIKLAVTISFGQQTAKACKKCASDELNQLADKAEAHRLEGIQEARWDNINSSCPVTRSIP